MAKGGFNLHFPCHWPLLADFNHITFDKHGVPLEPFGEEEQTRLNPAFTIAYGLHALTNFLENGDVRGRYDAVYIADWLRENLTQWRDGFFGWPTNFNVPFYNLKDEWVSAKTHGLAMSLLLRVASMDDDAKYEETAQKAVSIFMLSVSEGGFMRRFPDGSMGLEEYPAQEPVQTLAGQVFGLIGLFDYIEYFDNKMMKTMFLSALDGLKANLHRYDTGKWLLFDLRKSRRIAGMETVRGVCKMLNVLARLVDDEAIAGWAKKWLVYVDDESVDRKFWFLNLKEQTRLKLLPEKYGVNRDLLKDAPR